MWLGPPHGGQPTQDAERAGRSILTDDALPIGEVARRSGVPATTLRYYESIGILPEVERRSGRRAYPPSILEVLAVVRAARQAGLNLDAVKLLVADGEGLPERRWREVGEDRIRAIDDAVAGLERARRMVGLLMACQCRTIVECGRRLASQPIAETECELCRTDSEEGVPDRAVTTAPRGQGT